MEDYFNNQNGEGTLTVQNNLTRTMTVCRRRQAVQMLKDDANNCIVGALPDGTLFGVRYNGKEFIFYGADFR
jgi:hypothetical protein